MANLTIGSYIKFALAYEDMVDTPVFPIGQDGSNQGASFQPPFVTYKRNAFTEESTKDCTYEGSVSVAIDVVARTYDEMVNLLCKVQEYMHAAPKRWNEWTGPIRPGRPVERKPFLIVDQALTFGEETMDDTMTLYVCEVTAQIDTESR